MKIFFLIIASLLTIAPSGFAQSPYASLQVPKQIQYQGRVATGTGGAWTGTEGYFAFALVQGGATVLWNNWEGTASPSDPGTVSLGAGQVLTLPVNSGVFSIPLGEGSDTNEQIPATVFFDSVANAVRSEVKLAVWFSPDGGSFTRLSPDVEFSTVPFAMVAGIAETVKERAVTAAMLADGAVSALKLADDAVTFAKRQPRATQGVTASAGNLAIAASSNMASGSSTSDTQITNQSVTLDCRGGVVMISASSELLSKIGVKHSSSNTDITAIFSIYRNGVVIGSQVVQSDRGLNSSGSIGTTGVPPGSICFMDLPPAGQHVYSLRARVSSGSSPQWFAENIRMFALEL